MKRVHTALALAALIGCVHAGTAEPPPNPEAVFVLYLQISMARLEVARCQSEGVSAEKQRQFVALANADLHRLRDEFGVYIEGGQAGPVCGPICEEMLDFLKVAEESGLLSCHDE